MKRALLLAASAACFAGGTGSAWAGWSVSAEAESFRWRESTSPSVTESGPRFGIGASWRQEKDEGWLLGWRGKLYGGSTDYNGSLLLDSSTPVTGTTDYSGASNELQFIFRPGGASPGNFMFVGSLGLDSWERRLSARQKEDYTIGFVRIGFEYEAGRTQGWFGGAGVKKPIYTREDAHLRDIGYDQNPEFNPGKDPSLYGQVGYRFTPNWSLLAYYDSYRFGRSNTVTVTASRAFPGATLPFVQPQSSMDLLGLRLEYSF